MPGGGGKDKGQRGHGGSRSGLARLRRANAKKGGRLGNLERQVDDEDFMAQHEGTQRSAHTGQSLLAKFNRLSEHDTDLSKPNGIPAEVSGFQGTFTLARCEDGSEHLCQVRRRLKKMLRGEKSPLAVGDRVFLSITDEGDWVIETVGPRRNQLERRDSHNVSLSHVFAANVDQLVIVSAMRDPMVKTGLIDRYLLIAALAGVPACVVLNKVDLEPADELKALYQGLGFAAFATSVAQGSADITKLREHLQGKACVFAGHSGVGKSSLINALYPHFRARVGDVSTALHKGRHTTTAARSYLLDDGSRLIDTPGIRELGIHLEGPMDAGLHYPEIASRQQHCHYPDCTHTHEPQCAVKDAVAAGEIAVSRFGSYLALLHSDLGMDVSACADLVGEISRYSGEELDG